MKMKKFMAMITATTLCVAMLAGCGKKEDKTEATTTESVVAPDTMTTEQATVTDNPVEEGGTVGGQLLTMFKTEVETEQDVESLATKLSQHKVLADQNMVVEPVEEGFLMGFDEDIKGFKKCAKFAPMIGSIPFVAYVFETDNPEELVKTLKDHAMLNWNICTVADEMVVEASGNYVFFVMAPNSFE